MIYKLISVWSFNFSRYAAQHEMAMAWSQMWQQVNDNNLLVSKNNDKIYPDLGPGLF